MASLSEALYALPTERLRSLVQARDIDPKKFSLLPTKRQLVQLLTSELAKHASIAAALQQCNARDLRLLQLLVSLESGQVVKWKKILDALGAPDLQKALEPVMARLETLGLAFRIGDGILIPGPVTQQVPATIAARYTLARCLNAYDMNALRRICGTLELHVEPLSKNNCVTAICAHLLENGPALALKKPLDEEEIAVLEYLAQLGGAATALETASAALDGKTDDFFRYDWQNRWKQGRERNAIDRLMARGILHVVSQNYGFNLYLVIPGDLLRVLVGNIDQDFWISPDVALQTADAPPAQTVEAGLARDVVSLFGFVAAQEAVRTNTGYIHRTSLKNLARTLNLTSERYAAFLYAVCREADLIAPVGERQAYALTSRGQSWLQWPPAARSRALFEAWRTNTLWAEMINDPLQKASEYRPTEGVLQMRQAALALVVEGGADRWISLDSLTDALTFRHPLLLAQMARSQADLVASPSQFVRLLVGECLYWLGMAELGWADAPKLASAVAPVSEAGRGKRVGAGASAASATGEAGAGKAAAPNPLCYRLTALGAHLLGLTPAETLPAPPQEEKFIVQANAEIFVPPYLDPATLYHLLTLTDPPAKGATGNTVVLTRDSIRRALDMGATARDLLAFLQSHSRTGIPQNVEYLINEVGAKHGHIHIGRAELYLQVDSPLLMHELQTRRELKEYFVRSLGETVALLRGDDPNKLLRDLRKAGYLPISDDAHPAPASAFNANFNAGAKTRHAPPPPVSKPLGAGETKPSRARAKADTTVNWERLALEDGKPWNEKGAAEAGDDAPDDAARGEKALKSLFTVAVQRRMRVEIALDAGKGDIEQFTIDPYSVTREFVVAFSGETGEEQVYNIKQMRWARETGDVFA